MSFIATPADGPGKKNMVSKLTMIDALLCEAREIADQAELSFAAIRIEEALMIVRNQFTTISTTQERPI